VNYNLDDYIDWLTEQIVSTAEVLGHDIKATAAGMMAEDLSNYPPDVMKKAMRRVRSEHTGRLTLKAILDRVDEALGRPAANEAWAIALESLDEAKTVVWTEEMAQAWNAARPIAHAGDTVGARMAFIAAYERLVRDARDAGAAPVITVSLGWDATHRIAAVEKAEKLGYMPKAQAEAHLLEMRAAIAPPSSQVAGLLTSNAPDVTGYMQRLSELRAEFANADENRERRRAAQIRLERITLMQRKREIAQKVAEYAKAAA
jgi:hypothetical protein